MEQEILEQLKQINILTRVNNILLSKFILQLQEVKKKIHTPNMVSFFTFEILNEDYVELLKEFPQQDVDKALHWLDRQLTQNKMNCPNNIKNFILKRLKELRKNKKYNAKRQKTKRGQEEAEQES